MAGDSADLHVRPGTVDDLGEMARVHRASYGAGHFLALLPERTLADYYGAFLGGGTHTLVVERRSTAASTTLLEGFAVFGANIEPRIAEFKQRQRLAILSTAMRHPGISARKVLLRLLGDPSQSTSHEPAAWLLLSIAVRTHGRGIGGVLLREMLTIASANGQHRFGLYVRHTNTGAINAYLRAGFGITASVADQYYMEVTLRPITPSGAR